MESKMEEVKFGPYYLTRLTNGNSLHIQHERTQKDLILYNNEARLLWDEVTDLLKDHYIPNTRAARFTKSELADEVLGMYNLGDVK